MLQFEEGRLLLFRVLRLRYTFDITADQFHPHNFQQRPEILCKNLCVKNSSSRECKWLEVTVNPPLHNLYPPLQCSSHNFFLHPVLAPQQHAWGSLAHVQPLKQAGGWDFKAFCYQRLIQVWFFFPKIISCKPVPGLRCMRSDVFCLMEKHFLCFVEAACIPCAALELFVTAFLTPGAGQAGPLAHISRWTVSKRKAKHGSAAFKRGLGYFKHNTSLQHSSKKAKFLLLGQLQCPWECSWGSGSTSDLQRGMLCFQSLWSWNASKLSLGFVYSFSLCQYFEMQDKM